MLYDVSVKHEARFLYAGDPTALQSSSLQLHMPDLGQLLLVHACHSICMTNLYEKLRVKHPELHLNEQLRVSRDNAMSPKTGTGEIEAPWSGRVRGFGDDQLAWDIGCSQILAFLMQQAARQCGQSVVHLLHQLPG